MAVYVDPMFHYSDTGWWCHMTADNINELHEMADKLELKRIWFQSGNNKSHYDLKESKRKLAIKHGAIEVSRRDLWWIIMKNKIKQIDSLENRIKES